MSNKEIAADIKAARKKLKKEAKRLGTSADRLIRTALWNMVSDLEGTSLKDAREIACIDWNL